MLHRILINLVSGFLKCKNVDEERNRTQQTEIIFEPMKEFENKSHFLIARSLCDLVDAIVWVLNPTLEQKKAYKNARIASAEIIEKVSKIQKITLTILQNIEMNLILRTM